MSKTQLNKKTEINTQGSWLWKRQINEPNLPFLISDKVNYILTYIQKTLDSYREQLIRQ